jgi:predicted Zn-dependent peptidase
MGFRVFNDRLSNGLRLVTLELPHLHSALLALYVRAGSRHETPAQSGVGHFLEHMFFRGSEGFPDSMAMNATVEEVGGNLNGYTSRDHAFYFTPVHPDGLATAAAVLSDLIAAPLLKEMDLEREVILEEMLDEVDEEGRDIDLDNLTKRALWPGHPLALKIAGTPDTVRALRLDDLRIHHARWYGASNLVLCMAGSVTRAQSLEIAERTFSRFPHGELSQETAPPAPRPGPRLELFDHDESQTEFRLNFSAPPEAHPDFLPLMLLRRVLDDGLSSRLPLQIVEKRGLAYSIHCGIDAFSDVAIFEVEAATAPGKVAATIDEIGRTLGQLCSEGPTSEELRRAKLRHRMGLTFLLDSPGDLAAWFAGTTLFREPPTLEARGAAVDAIPAEEVIRVARQVLSRRNLLVTAVGNPTAKQRTEIARAVERAEGLD